MIDGFGSEIYKGTIFVETGVEENFNKRQKGVDENWRLSVRYYHIGEYKEFEKEIFDGYQHLHNTLFDYNTNPKLVATFGETSK